ncbi:MAG: peptide ABC transporter permease [Aliihoeflea sp.]
MDRQDQQRIFSGRDTSQGHIVLRTPLRKAIFIAGLAGIVILSAILAAGCIPTPPA